MAEIIQRPGVDGTGFVKTGKKGEEFTVHSTVDLANKYVANAVGAAYHSLEHSGLHNVVFSDVDYATAGVRFVVRRVRVVAIRNLSRSVGGLNAGKTWLEAEWTLIPVIVS